LPPEIYGKIKKTIDNANSKTQELIQNYQNGSLPRLPGQTLEESLEIYIMNELAKARDASGNIADDYFGMENHGIIMTRNITVKTLVEPSIRRILIITRS